MSSFILAILKLLSSFKRGLRDPEFRALFILLLAMLISGTVFYTTVEHWSVVDSLYFSVSTLSTVGYGDLHPTTTLSKVFTIFYLVLGVGVFVGLITKVAQLRSDRLVNRAKSGRRGRTPPPTDPTEAE